MTSKPSDFHAHLATELQTLRDTGLYKQERIITTPQGALIRTADGREVLNLCANNYLGLSSHPAVVAAAHEALRTHGYGLSSVRFICGTQDLHKTLEGRLSRFLGTEDTILYAAAFDANGGLFEPLLGEQDAVISDELNHASIIDGIRLCKARRYRYKHNDMADLERCLAQAQAEGARFKLVFTDGVFSMDGTVAQLDRMRALCDAHGALLGIDECHASGFMGRSGRGTHEHRGVLGKIDIITGTLGKALGGGLGRLHQRAPRGDRPAAPALAAIPVLQHRRAVHRGRLHRRAGPAGRQHGAARQARRQHALLPRRHHAGGLRHQAGEPRK